MNKIKPYDSPNGHFINAAAAKSDDKATCLKVIFINSHPIQYYAPLYQYMSSQGGVDLKVLYCSKHGLTGEMDAGFQVKVTWDIPLLDGYESVFFKNYSPAPNVDNLWGLINFGIIRYLWRAPKSVLVIHGWNYLTNLMAIVVGKLKGHIVCIRGDSPGRYEARRGWFVSQLRKFIFGRVLFPAIDYCLYVGKENKTFYKMYGVPERKLLFSPHAVDNHRFSQSHQQLAAQKDTIREALGLPVGKKVILFVGKFIGVKRPMDLLQAFAASQRRAEACLVFVGEGVLRKEMEDYIAANEVEDVYLTGFINQSKIPQYYSVADIFVMCSESESWGLVVNEAMNFQLPLILSDLTSCSDDLLLEGENGYSFKTGDVQALSKTLDSMLELPDEKRKALGLASKKRVERYSYANLTQSLEGIKLP